MPFRIVNRSTIAGVVVLALLAMAVFAPKANAQAGASITATPAGAADTYQVTGTGFSAGTKYKVIEVTCGLLPCAAGGGALVVTTPDAAGRFSVTLTLSDIVPTDRDYRVIAAFPDDRAGLATDPQVQVPLHTSATPLPPATGDGLGLEGSAGENFALVGVGLLFVAAATVMAATAVRARR